MGGAIYIEETNKNKKDSDGNLKYYFNNTIFFNNQAEIGGAIYAKNP